MIMLYDSFNVILLNTHSVVTFGQNGAMDLSCDHCLALHESKKPRTVLTTHDQSIVLTTSITTLICIYMIASIKVSSASG